jgi:hypothetical protein
LRACLTVALMADLALHSFSVINQTFRIPINEITGPAIHGRIVQNRT